jgi:hypothetical protein
VLIELFAISMLKYMISLSVSYHGVTRSSISSQVLSLVYRANTHIRHARELLIVE